MYNAWHVMYTMLLIFLITEGQSCCSLEEVLVFFSGADHPPPLGFPHTPQLNFLPKEALFPTASTCSLILRLPTRYHTYDMFRDAFTRGLKENDGFGAGP